MREFHHDGAYPVIRTVFTILAVLLAVSHPATSAEPASLDAAKIARASGAKTTTLDDGVVRIGWSRDDVKVKVDGMAFPASAGLGSWAAFKPTVHGAVVMGDTVVLRDEVDAAIDAALAHGLDVTALHNHFFFDEPNVFFMHIGGHGDAEKLAAGVKATWDAIKQVRAAHPQPADGFGGPKPTPGGKIDADRIGSITGLAAASKTGGVVKVSKGREGEMNETPMDGSMGLASWAAFVGSDDLASMDGDFVMTGPEVQPVLHALRKHHIHVVALHNHMIGDDPRFYFVHFWGVGPAAMLAEAFRATLDAQSRQAATPAPKMGEDKNRQVWNFDTDVPGAVPASWSIRQTRPTKALATWKIVTELTAPSPPNVMALTKTENDDPTFNLAIAEGTSLTDIDLTVKVKAISGETDQGGGPIWRCRDEKNYYVARFNPLESNFRVYFVKNGVRKQLDSARIATQPGRWYTVRVTMVGDHITCYLDGQKELEATDDTFDDAGMVGLWTKSDAATRFDDLSVGVAHPQEASPLRGASNLRGASPLRGASMLTLRRTIALPGVKGRIDHLTLDPKDNRLFLAARNNGTLEVVDLGAGKRIYSISGLHEPQGIAYLPQHQRVVVACGGDGTVRAFDARTFTEIAQSYLGADADDIQWDASQNLLYVAYGDGALGVMEAEGLTTRGEIKLSGHPERFQLAKSNSRVYVNVPDAKRVAVVDREKKAVVASWPMTAARDNFPMALDEENHRVFVACRRPPRFLVIDMESGATVANKECVSNADDMFYDVKRNRIYVVGGEGFLDVFDGSVAGGYPRLAHIPTSPGAQTALLVPQRNTLYLAVPEQEEQSAEVRVFQVSP